MCLIEDIRNIIGDVALFPYSEVLSCQHGLDSVRAIDCIRSVVGEYNGDKFVAATRENGGLADQVRGLPLVAIAADEQITYLMPSNAQMEYVADHGPEVANQMNEEKRQFKQRRENLRQRAINKGIR